MKHLFLDTNIVLDFLADRKPFSVAAAKLFQLSEQAKITLYISAVSYNNIYSILRQHMPHTKVISLLSELEEITQVQDVTRTIVKEAIKSDFKDFEDAIQNYTALSNKRIEMIVTRDSKDFKTSSLAVLTPLEALKGIGME